MKLRLKNSDLQDTLELLNSLDLKNKDSRSRTKMAKAIYKVFESFVEEEQTLLREHNLMGADGDLIPDSQRNPEDVLRFKQEQAILLDEVVIIESGAFANNFKEMERILNEYEGEFNGRNAYLYDLLLDEIERDKEEGKND